jgi:hypothetical protein
MLASQKGTILFTGATGALRGPPGLSSFSPGKFGLRSLCQIITREYQPDGTHAAFIVVDSPVDGKLIGGVRRRAWEREGATEKLQDLDSHLMQPNDLAQTYWFLHTQPRSAWTHEIDVRPQKEGMYSRLWSLLGFKIKCCSSESFIDFGSRQYRQMQTPWVKRIMCLLEKTQTFTRDTTKATKAGATENRIWTSLLETLRFTTTTT